MRDTDIRMLREDLEQGIRLAQSLGIDASDIVLPHRAALGGSTSALREIKRGVRPRRTTSSTRTRCVPSDSVSPGDGGSSS